MDPMVVGDASAILGTDTARESIADWLDRITESADQQGPVELNLYRIDIDQTEHRLGSFKHLLEQSVADTVSEIVKVAYRDAGRDPSAYRVSYVVAVDGREEAHHTNFELEVMSPRGVYPAASNQRAQPYGPDIEGLTSQLMEQDLDLTHIIVEQSGALDARTDRYVARLEERIRLLEKNEWVYRREIERLLDRSAERRMMLENNDAELKRKDQYVDVFKAILPLLAGAAVGPQAVNIAAMIKSVMGAKAGAAAGDEEGELDEDEDEREERDEDEGDEDEGDADGGMDPAFVAGAEATFEHIDGIMIVVEKHPNILSELVQLLGQAGEKDGSKAVGHLMALHEGSMARRKTRGQTHPAAGRRPGAAGARTRPSAIAPIPPSPPPPRGRGRGSNAATTNGRR